MQPVNDRSLSTDSILSYADHILDAETNIVYDTRENKFYRIENARDEALYEESKGYKKGHEARVAMQMYIFDQIQSIASPDQLRDIRAKLEPRQTAIRESFGASPLKAFVKSFFKPTETAQLLNETEFLSSLQAHIDDRIARLGEMVLMAREDRREQPALRSLAGVARKSLPIEEGAGSPPAASESLHSSPSLRRLDISSMIQSPEEEAVEPSPDASASFHPLSTLPRLDLSPSSASSDVSTTLPFEEEEPSPGNQLFPTLPPLNISSMQRSPSPPDSAESSPRGAESDSPQGVSLPVSSSRSPSLSPLFSHSIYLHPRLQKPLLQPFQLKPCQRARNNVLKRKTQ